MRQPLQMKYRHNTTLLIYFLGALGTVVEWYDFAIYGHLAPVFAQLFFVKQKHWLALILTYSIFFASYLSRPIGSILYGYIGDNLGRKAALVLSIFMMNVTMLIMAFLPTYKTIGSMAPLLLLIFRIVQGISAGGETTGSFVYVLESVTHKRYGLYGSATWSMTIVGTLLGSAIVALLTSLLSQSQLLDWGWRLAYVIGIGFGLVVFILRAFMPESIEFSQAKKAGVINEGSDGENSPVREVFLYHKSAVLMVACLAAMPAAGVVFIFYYFPQSINQYHHVALSKGLDLNTLMLLIMIFSMILFGYLSDFIGRMRMIPFGAICFLLFSYPIMLMTKQNGWLLLIAAQFFLTMMLAMYEGPFPGLIVTLASVKVRYTVIALGFNIGFALFGGAAPLMGALLVHHMHNRAASAFYLMSAAVLSLVAILILLKNKKRLIISDNK